MRLTHHSWRLDARCGPGRQVVEVVARRNGKTEVLGMNLSQLEDDGDSEGLTIMAPLIDPVGTAKNTDGWDVRELFQTPTRRKATLSMWVADACYEILRLSYSSTFWPNRLGLMDACNRM